MPGSAAVKVVSITATVQGTIDEFTQARQQVYKETMATTLGVAVNDVALILTPGSVIVETQVKIPDQFGAAVEAFIMSNIASVVVSAANAAGAQVVNISAPKSIVAIRASPPPSAPPSPSPPPPPQPLIIDDAAAALGASKGAPSSGLPSGLAWGVTLGILLPVITTIGIGIFFLFKWTRRDAAQPKNPSTVAIQSPAQESATIEDQEAE